MPGRPYPVPGMPPQRKSSKKLLVDGLLPNC